MKDLCIVYFSIGNTIFSARIMATGIIPLANNVRHISLQNLDMDNLEWKAGFSSTKTTFKTSRRDIFSKSTNLECLLRFPPVDTIPEID